MNRITIACAVFFVLLAAAGPAGARERAAEAPMRDIEGNSVGRVEFSEAREGAVRIEVELHSLPPGEKALHIHEKPCGEASGFLDAGGHFNPHGREHGFLNKKGPHAGDLPNITVREDGTARAVFVSNRITLREGEKHSIFRAPGTSVVIHEGPDDYFTDPAGEAGVRIACGNIRKIPDGDAPEAARVSVLRRMLGRIPGLSRIRRKTGE